jgi:hypothetical protein
MTGTQRTACTPILLLPVALYAASNSQNVMRLFGPDTA